MCCIQDTSRWWWSEVDGTVPSPLNTYVQIHPSLFFWPSLVQVNWLLLAWWPFPGHHVRLIIGTGLEVDRYEWYLVYIYICDHILVVLLSFKCTLHIIIMLVYANLSTFRPFLPFNNTQTTKTLRDFVPLFHFIPLSIYVHLQFSLSYLFALSFPLTFPVSSLVDSHHHSVDDGERMKKKVFFLVWKW